MTDNSPEDPRQTSFFAILGYVLGFMIALGLLAWGCAWLLRHLH